MIFIFSSGEPEPYFYLNETQKSFRLVKWPTPSLLSTKPLFGHCSSFPITAERHDTRQKDSRSTYEEESGRFTNHCCKYNLLFYLTIFGCSYCFSILPSCRNFFFCSSGRVTLQVLTATDI